MTSSPWPLTTRLEAGSLVSIGGVQLDTLAERYGTPLWVVDEHDLRTRCRSYREAFEGSEVAYASKAWCTTGIVQIAAGEGLSIDVASEGELTTAAKAGVPGRRIILHGNNKSDRELEMAADLGVGRVVVDSFDELERMERIGAARHHVFRCWLRITPGIDAHTHQYVRTGHDDSKFGFTLSLGLADAAIERSLAMRHAEVVGIHAHIGSQIFGTAPFTANVEVLIDLLARWRDRHGITLGELNAGGGMAIRYTREDHPVGPADYARALRETLRDASAHHGYPMPRLVVEPGRALVGPAAITLYRVGTVKRLPGIRTYASVDGGMSDNIRPALYDAEHEVALAGRAGGAAPEPVTVVGKHCESGDLIREHAALAGDLAPGDLLAVAATGAYTEAMASNYNRLPRPGAVRVRDGEARWLVRPETLDEVLARDVALDVES